MDIDDLLAMVENPTRRRILEMLMVSPSYPLQLSKDLGVSQQAVMKNLTLLQRNGLVECYRESSSMGPDRTVYAPSMAFTLVVDMHGNMFSVRLLPESEAEVEAPPDEEEILERIREIDDQIAKLERKRSELMHERDALSMALSGMREGGDRTTRRAETPLRNGWK